MCPNDPDATKKLKECEKAVMKLKFEEAISVPQSEKRSIAESIDFHSIGTILGWFLVLVSLFYQIFCASLHLCTVLLSSFLCYVLLFCHAVMLYMS